MSSVNLIAAMPQLRAVKSEFQPPARTVVPKVWLELVVEQCVSDGCTKKQAIAEARSIILESRKAATSDAEWAAMWAPVSSASPVSSAPVRSKRKPSFSISRMTAPSAAPPKQRRTFSASSAKDASTILAQVDAGTYNYNCSASEQSRRIIAEMQRENDEEERKKEEVAEVA